MKSNDRRSDLFSGQTSKQYSSIDRHLLFTKCRKMSSDADLPSLPNNAFTDLKKERLALSKEHLNLQDRTMKTPKYLMLSTQARGVPSAHDRAAHLTLID